MKIPTVYPVYDCARPDYTRDSSPIGHASTEAEALKLLERHFEGAELDQPLKVELNDRDTSYGQLWAYWLLPIEH